MTERKKPPARRTTRTTPKSERIIKATSKKRKTALKRLADNGEPDAITSAQLLKNLDRPEIRGAIRVPGERQPDPDPPALTAADERKIAAMKSYRGARDWRGRPMPQKLTIHAGEPITRADIDRLFPYTVETP